MWCEKCEKEYEGTGVCPECGGELSGSAQPSWSWSRYGEILDKWPLDAGGEPETPKLLKRVSSLNLEDVMLLNMLEAYGIPGLRQYPNDGQFVKVILGTPATGVEVFVPESMYEDAKALVEGSEDVDGL